MAPRGTTGKEGRNSGPGEGGEGQKGQGHVPKSKRLRVDEASSENDDDFQSEAAVVVDEEGTPGGQRLGFGRDRVSRDQLAAIRQAVVGGVAGASPRTHKAQRQVAGVGEATPRQQAAFAHRSWQSDSRGRSSHFCKRSHGSLKVWERGGSMISAAKVVKEMDNGKAMMMTTDPLQVNLEERSRLWVDSDAFWGQGPRKPLREAIGDCADYFVAVANGDAGAEPPSMIIMPPNDLPRFKIDDPAQREPALRRACIVEKLVN
ncbi:hypothetical protein CBR_g4174 [Chara braunii]|uniref:Uncharacterized protein n=1 Tax=Chara braunii TaxID=69332 RepID=A0A388KHE2_CHABU|nr:hypothetical protein CBR_g4174 [Chara braunii]|eukprot:GBG69480.1 hypothetical protein CBR_g4174 [Chara braunii]